MEVKIYTWVYRKGDFTDQVKLRTAFKIHILVHKIYFRRLLSLSTCLQKHCFTSEIINYNIGAEQNTKTVKKRE